MPVRVLIKDGAKMQHFYDRASSFPDAICEGRTKLIGDTTQTILQVLITKGGNKRNYQKEVQVIVTNENKGLEELQDFP